jgi:hypothetical protein
MAKGSSYTNKSTVPIQEITTKYTELIDEDVKDAPTFF